MKKNCLLFICIACLLTVGCSNERHVNGRSYKSALRSSKALKNHLYKDKKLEFQVAFWTLKEGYPEKQEFLDSVDGKTADEIIAAGQAKFDEMRSSGFTEYQKYSNWDDMIAQDKQERAQQDLGLEKDKQKMMRDKTNNVLYDLH